MLDSEGKKVELGVDIYSNVDRDEGPVKSISFCSI